MAPEPANWEHLRLHTERLCLRRPTSRDAENLYALFADPETMQALGKEPVSALTEARAMIESGIAGWRSDGLGPFVVETTAADRQVVGQAGLMVFDARDWTPSTWTDAGTHAQPELGWALIRAYRGRGYATEAAAAIRDWARERRSIDRPARLVDLARQRRLPARRREARRGASRNRHAGGHGGPTVVWRYQLCG